MTRRTNSTGRGGERTTLPPSGVGTQGGPRIIRFTGHWHHSFFMISNEYFNAYPTSMVTLLLELLRKKDTVSCAVLRNFARTPSRTTIACIVPKIGSPSPLIPIPLMSVTSLPPDRNASNLLGEGKQSADARTGQSPGRQPLVTWKAQQVRKSFQALEVIPRTEN